LIASPVKDPLTELDAAFVAGAAGVADAVALLFVVEEFELVEVLLEVEEELLVAFFVAVAVAFLFATGAALCVVAVFAAGVLVVTAAESFPGKEVAAEAPDIVESPLFPN